MGPKTPFCKSRIVPARARSPFYPFYHVRTSGFEANPRSLRRLGRPRPCQTDSRLGQTQPVAAPAVRSSDTISDVRESMPGPSTTSMAPMSRAPGGTVSCTFSGPGSGWAGWTTSSPMPQPQALATRPRASARIQPVTRRTAGPCLPGPRPAAPERIARCCGTRSTLPPPFPPERRPGWPFPLLRGGVRLCGFARRHCRRRRQGSGVGGRSDSATAHFVPTATRHPGEQIAQVIGPVPVTQLVHRGELIAGERIPTEQGRGRRLGGDVTHTGQQGVVAFPVIRTVTIRAGLRDGPGRLRPRDGDCLRCVIAHVCITDLDLHGLAVVVHRIVNDADEGLVHFLSDIHPLPDFRARV